MRDLIIGDIQNQTDMEIQLSIHRKYYIEISYIGIINKAFPKVNMTPEFLAMSLNTTKRVLDRYVVPVKSE